MTLNSLPGYMCSVTHYLLKTVETQKLPSLFYTNLIEQMETDRMKTKNTEKTLCEQLFYRRKTDGRGSIYVCLVI